MAYNRENYLKKAAFIVSVYNMYKDQGIMHDTKIIREHFPKHGIHIKYRQWMNIKGETIPKPCFVNKDFVNDYETIIEEFKPKTGQKIKFKI